MGTEGQSPPFSPDSRLSQPLGTTLGHPVSRYGVLRSSRSPAADVDGGSQLGVRLRFPQDLVRDGGGVALPEEQKAQQVHDRVALRPPEVAVRRLVGRVAQVEQQRGDGVGHHRALGTQDLVAADLHALHLQHVLELRGIFYLYLEEEDRLACREVVVLALPEPVAETSGRTRQFAHRCCSCDWLALDYPEPTLSERFGDQYGNL